ncbi:MAG: hypothetical protein BWY63_00994 [Chloroflexi bacterium ADurb.Bin360]|nr:MAG: hypothetical protein BWY63_00994 [Chloroflexi bacterium ADurb.Bin360]
METSWFVWIWALVAMLVVSGMLAAVFVGLTVLRLVRRQWARLASEPAPAPRPGPRSRASRAKRLDPRDERA